MEKEITKNYYSVLGIEKGALSLDIKRAYRKMALKYHPDKNKSSTSEAKFKEIGEAYEILSDQSKKKLHDSELATREAQHKSFNFAQTSKETTDKNFEYKRQKSSYNTKESFKKDYNQRFHKAKNMPKHNNNDPSSSKYKEENIKNIINDLKNLRKNLHKSNLEKNKNTPCKAKPIIHNLFLSIEEVALGCIKKVNIMYKTPDILNGCQINEEEKKFTVNVKPGWKEGTKITFENEGDSSPGKDIGDVIIIIKDKPHPVFKRDGENIIYVSKVPEKDASNPFIPIPTLSSFHYYLDLSGEIVTPQTSKILKGYGLPFLKNPEEKGDLIVYFEY